MTLMELKGSIDLLVDKGYGKKTVVYSSDEEGNSYDDLFYHPSVMEIKDIKDIYRGEGKGKVICIN